MALGKGSGKTGDASFTVYFYGERLGDSQPGMFRSTDEGKTWERLCYYPCGLFCQTVKASWSLAASWDEFGLIAMNTGGQGFLYGKLIKSTKQSKPCAS